MRWKFWEKEKSQNTVKAGKPVELPSSVGKYLVVNLKYDPDWVWNLKAVTMAKEDRKGFFIFRIFDPDFTGLRGVKIQNYTSLDNHPELVYFDGWYDKNSWDLMVNDHYKAMRDIAV